MKAFPLSQISKPLALLTLALLTALPALAERRDTTVVQRIEITDTDGALRIVSAYTHTPAGQVASCTYYQVSDGIQKAYQKTEYQYDAAGRTVQSKNYWTNEDGTGLYNNETINYAYDADGRKTLEETLNYEEDGSRSSIVHEETTYDAEGRVVLSLRLLGWDETTNYYTSCTREEYTYAPNGVCTHYANLYNYDYAPDAPLHIEEQTDQDENERPLLTVQDVLVGTVWMSEKKVYEYDEAQKTKTVSRYLSPDNYTYTLQDVETTTYADQLDGKIKQVAAGSVLTTYYYTED